MAEEGSFRAKVLKIYSSRRAVGMWESRSDFQGGWEAPLLGFPPTVISTAGFSSAFFIAGFPTSPAAVAQKVCVWPVASAGPFPCRCARRQYVRASQGEARCAGTELHRAAPAAFPAVFDSAGNGVAGGLSHRFRSRLGHRGDGSSDRG